VRPWCRRRDTCQICHLTRPFVSRIKGAGKCGEGPYRFSCMSGSGQHPFRPRSHLNSPVGSGPLFRQVRSPLAPTECFVEKPAGASARKARQRAVHEGGSRSKLYLNYSPRGATWTIPQPSSRLCCRGCCGSCRRRCELPKSMGPAQTPAPSFNRTQGPRPPTETPWSCLALYRCECWPKDLRAMPASGKNK